MGLEDTVMELYDQKIKQFDDYSTFVKAYKLFFHKNIVTKYKLDKK